MSSSESQPLPTDWEMKYDFSLKRYFYVNHKEKITTWDDPRKKKNDNLIQKEGFSTNDYVEDEADMDKIIKLTEKEDQYEKDLNFFCGKYPGFKREYIKELLIKSKGNASTVEVILRQERRKETSSIISYSTIDSGVKKKLCEGEQTRFSLSERNKYDVPETSKDRIKSKLRSEFATVDNRIVDRVLEVTDYSLEESRKILLDKCKSLEENIKIKGDSKKSNEDLPNFKHFVSRRSINTEGNRNSEDRKYIKNKKSIAAGPDPKNYSGSQSSKNLFKQKSG